MTTTPSVRPVAPPDTARSVLRGFKGRCPACGEGRLFGRFLKVAESCTACGQVFAHHRADDFPPYLVMFAVGHLVGYGIYTAEMRVEAVPLWLHALVWPTLAIGLSLALLQPVKGAVVGLQFGLGMHGFGAEPAFLAAAEGAHDGRGVVRDVAGAPRVIDGLAEPAPEGRRKPDHPRPER